MVKDKALHCGEIKLHVRVCHDRCGNVLWGIRCLMICDSLTILATFAVA